MGVTRRARAGIEDRDPGSSSSPSRQARTFTVMERLHAVLPMSYPMGIDTLAPICPFGQG